MDAKYSLCLIFLLVACSPSTKEERENYLDLAANDEVAEYMRQFKGRGVQSDASQLPAVDHSLQQFRVEPGLEVQAVLTEPAIHQPVELAFDHRGRLWVVQYSQYPYPKGLKVTGIDHHIRMQFDKVPEPPPEGLKGADKISFFEDTDGDGWYDKATDAITGLNIATGVTWGRGKIWVLNPPYLLAYPDADADGLPEGDPVVHIEGFGLEDTHAVANSLRWGPDGWLYGATGSTVTSKINTAKTKDLYFEGQSIWRYHPSEMIFEIFAEGGGNTFHVEMDAKGRIYSGTNGVSRGQYYKQGGYYTKNWGKHGPLTNPYAYGYLGDMHFTGQRLRFTHAWIKYEADGLPELYADKMIGINPLHNFLLRTRMEPNGSSFATIDEARILQTDDRWFRPVDIKVGPDGAIYIADWCDSRLSHVNPQDTWHRESGRIYRLAADSASNEIYDITQLPEHELLRLLYHKNKWYRQMALQRIADLNAPSMLSALTEMLDNGDGQTALESLWAIHLLGGLEEAVAVRAMNHTDPYVRMWAVRLSVDAGLRSDAVIQSLQILCRQERHPEVISQLAASARRVEGPLGWSMIEGLARQIDPDDPDNPLMLWWAMEAQIDQQHQTIEKLFADPSFWEVSVIKTTILERLMQRLIQGGSAKDYQLAEALFRQVPGSDLGLILMDGLTKGLVTRDFSDFPKSLLVAMQPYQTLSSQSSTLLNLQLRGEEALSDALKSLSDDKTPVHVKLGLIGAVSKYDDPRSIEVLLALAKNKNSPATVIVSSLANLSRFAEDSIALRILDDYPDHLRADRRIRMAALYFLTSRSSWSELLWKRVFLDKEIHAEDLVREIVLQMKLSIDPMHFPRMKDVWPQAFALEVSDSEREINRLLEIVADGEGNKYRGAKLFQVLCSSCHLMDSLPGGSTGPDLTGYDFRDQTTTIYQIAAPNADIREGYLNYLVRMKDDRFLTGRIEDQSAHTLTLRTHYGESMNISQEKVQKLEAQPLSLMPEGLLTDLPDDQVRDLLTFLSER